MLKVNYPSESFLASLEYAKQKLKQIGQGKEIGVEYEYIKKQLIVYANSHDTEIIIKNQSDIRRILSVLIQEVAKDNDILQLLIQKSKLDVLFKQLDEQLDNDHKNLIAKKILTLYYSRFFSFHSLSDDERHHFDKMLLRLVRSFDGKTMMVLNAKANPEIFSRDLTKILSKYKNIKTVFEELILLESYEIWQHILILYLLEQVKQWSANQWDNHVETVLNKILEYKNIPVGRRNLLEETVFIVIQQCKAVNDICNAWLNFIFGHIGDPRIARHQSRWIRIGEEYYLWLRARLSVEDARAFLTNMTDGQGDTHYQYRRQFWLQYIDKISYAKVMLNASSIQHLIFYNNDMYKRFQSSPEIYSRLNDSERSCILMVFDNFYVIEGTHNAKLRFYQDMPIDVQKREYDYAEFYAEKVQKILIEEFAHHNSKNYFWQNKVRCFIDAKFHIHVALENIILNEDKHRVKHIKDYLYNQGYSIE